MTPMLYCHRSLVPHHTRSLWGSLIAIPVPHSNSRAFRLIRDSQSASRVRHIHEPNVLTGSNAFLLGLNGNI